MAVDGVVGIWDNRSGIKMRVPGLIKPAAGNDEDETNSEAWTPKWTAITFRLSPDWEV